MLVVTALLAVSFAAVQIVDGVKPSAAANDGSLELTFAGPDSVLLGANATYSLSAFNNGSTVDGYNLSWRVVLPVGTTLVSSTIGNPETTISDSPSVGETTLMWTNASDLQVNVTKSFSIEVAFSTATWDVTMQPSLSAGAYLSNNARLIPDFNADGTHNNTTDTSAFAETTTATRIEAIELTKEEPNAESELLRGVHDEWTTYSLTVQNNYVNPTDTIVVEDYLPAGLELLGCGSIDNTSATPSTNLTDASTDEYGGAGALGIGVVPVDPTANAITALCLSPDEVETVTLAANAQFVGQDPGVYTRVRWVIDSADGIGVYADGDLDAGEAFELMYAAGIPLRQNTAFTSPLYPGLATAEMANLGNNDGTLTADEQQWVNWARASGIYNPGVADLATKSEDSHIVIAEDLSVHKTVSAATFVQTDQPRWSLLIETGEYRNASSIVVTDTLPDGQCPILINSNPETSAPIGTDCAAGVGLDPTLAASAQDPDTVTENVDGSWTLVWTATPTMTESDQFLIEFSSVVRGDYQQNYAPDLPVVGADYFINNVDIVGTTDPLNDSGNNEPDRVLETTTIDASSARQDSATVVIDKAISQPAAAGTALSCDTATYVATRDADQGFKPGDRVCYRIGVDFTLNLDFRNPQVTDFIPPNTTFEKFWVNAVSGATANNTATIATTELVDFGAGDGITDAVLWSLGTDPGNGDLFVAETAARFEVIFSVTIDGNPRDANYVDIIENLAKLTHQNSAHLGGEAFSSRDLAGFPFVEPHLTISKLNAVAPNTATATAESGVQGTVLDYEVAITNDFASTGVPAQDAHAAARAIATWDILPDNILCSAISTIAVSTGETATCYDPVDVGFPLTGQTTATRSVISYSVTSLAPGAVSTLSYQLTVPANIAAGVVLTNDAGVRSFDGPQDNTGGTLTYIPASNIDQTAPTATVSALNAQATVNIDNITLTKTQSSTVTDATGASNRSNAADLSSSATQDATIGESLNYRFDATIPVGVDAYSLVLTDPIDSKLSFTGLTGGEFNNNNPSSVVSLTITNAAAGDGFFDLGGTAAVYDAATDILVELNGVGPVLGVTFPATWQNPVGAGIDTVWLSYDAQLTSGARANNLDNYAYADWNDANASKVAQASSNRARTKVVEPSLSITKTDDGTDTNVPTDAISNVSAGDLVTYTLTVTNPTHTHGSYAHDLVVTDSLPVGLQFTDNANNNPDAATWTAGAPSGGTLVWTITELAVGASTTLTYKATVATESVAATQLTNTAVVTASSMAGTVAGERTSYTANTTNTIELPLGLLAKDIAPFDANPFDLTDTDISEFRVGEAANFELTVQIPSGSRTYDTTLFDTLPSFVQFDSYGTPSYSGTECQFAGTNTALVANDALRLTPNGQVLGWYFGDIEADGANCNITLPYSVHIDAIATTASAGTNSSVLHWHNTNTIVVDPTGVSDLGAETWDKSTDPATESISVVEPNLAMDKDVQVVVASSASACEPSPDADTCDTESGATHRYTVTVTNNGDGAAHDLIIVDTLPVEGTSVASNFTGATPVYNAAAGTLTWSVTGPLAAAGSLVYTYDVVVGSSNILSDDQILTNTADVTSYYAMSSADRAAAPVAADVPQYGGTRNPVAADSVALTVEFPDLVIVKTPASGMDATDARTGLAFRWNLTVHNDGTGTAYNVDVDDVLPAGWLYSTGSAKINTGGGFVTLSDPSGSTSGPLLWTNVLTSLAAGSSAQIEYDLIPQATLLTLATTGAVDHVNDSGVAGEDYSGQTANQTGSFGDDNDAADGVRGSDNANARIRRVDLAISKSIVESAPYFYGDFLTYRIVVTNESTTASVDTATGISVLDVLPNTMIFQTATTANGSYNSSTNTWTLASGLAQDATATLDIVARINSASQVMNHAEIETADQWDIDSTPANYNEGTGTDEDDSDFVSFTPATADLGNRLWFDADANGILDVGEYGLSGVDVTVSWINPDGGATVSLMTTTNGDGEYAFGNLPQDIDLTVTVDNAGLPAGLTPTFELVDNPTITDTQANKPQSGVHDGIVTQIMLTSTNATYLDVDFGYTGAGSLGDYIWYDLNLDGVQDANETPLAGITVTTDWAGFDGVLGDEPSTVSVDESADDVRYLATTDATGAYLAPNLAPGEYTVTVTTSDLPNDIDIATWDHDFATSGIPTDLDDTTSYTLAANEDFLGLDFGYAGPGRVGDTVWLDRNSNGTLDTDEVGLAAVTVTATFTEPGGAVVVRAVDTGADGTYLFTGLPLDIAIAVTVDTIDLPASVVATHDLDDPADASVVTGSAHAASAILTTATTERLDVDFGYAGVSNIGDAVWLDLDASGDAQPQPDDIALPNVLVSLRWTNPGASDLVVSTTTDAAGNYLFSNLPDGSYVIYIDPTSLPGGVTANVDPDGGADNTAALTLSGADNLDQDFAYYGTGSIGDLVWNDLDADGLVSAGETGFENVAVAAVWVDPTTGATANLATSTDVNGIYGFANLPAGDYTVSINPATLPEAMAPTHDLVGELDRTAAFTLAPGAAQLDVDFGERLESDLEIIKTSADDFVIDAQNVWTLSVINHGPSIATGAITLTDTLPAEVTFVRVDSTEWSCAAVDSTITCAFNNSPLGVGATSNLSLVVTAKAAAAPSVTNAASVDMVGGPVDPDPTNNTDTDTANVPLSLIHINKSLMEANVVTGQVANWRIVITNYGPSPTTGVVQVIDDLPDGLGYVRSTGAGLSCTSVANRVSCDVDSAMAVGDELTLEITTIVTAAVGTEITNRADVLGGTLVNGQPLAPSIVDGIRETILDPGAGLDAALGIDVPVTGILDTSTSRAVSALAFTGANPDRLLGVALALFAMGVAFSALGRRRSGPQLVRH